MVGEGSFGKVTILMIYIYICKRHYAMKIMRKDVIIEADDIMCAMLERDILAMGKDCKFLTCLATSFQTTHYLIYVMEFLSGGDLMFHFEKCGRFTYKTVKFYGAQIYIALSYLHNNDIMYRDLKMDNILMTMEGNLKLADFGMCRKLIGAEQAYTFCGTPGSMAPEIIMNKPYTYTVDWWSYGVLIYEMYTGLSCFEGDEEEEIFSSVVNSNIFYPKKMELDLKQFIESILVRNVEQRIDNCSLKGEKISTFTFYDNIEWEAMTNLLVTSPFVPTNNKLAQNFDNQFTQKPAKISTYRSSVLNLVPKNYFEEFDLTIEAI
ncbi:hypothetical protein A3Q56_07750 [Intoshia linei]|uniref:Protein kinase domain-containing protein n=1 Tax=Intoshia linei TaxID=1819745 RepID=A0A177ARU2_9BILA|nr:hypothetical protein A3Q56_07750 [Intoshia linei]